jgi:cold shock CspA family protein
MLLTAPFGLFAAINSEAGRIRYIFGTSPRGMRRRKEFIVQKGTIKSFDKSCGMGVIVCRFEDDIMFYEESVVGRSRAGLQKGDEVCFDINNIKNLHIAVNVTKCA